MRSKSEMPYLLDRCNSFDLIGRQRWFGNASGVQNRYAIRPEAAICSAEKLSLNTYKPLVGNNILRNTDRRVFLVPAVVRGNSLRTATRTRSNEGNSRATCSSSAPGNSRSDLNGYDEFFLAHFV